MSVGRSDGRTVGLMAAALLSVCPTVRLSAQVEVQLSAAARYTSALVTDRIVTPFDVRPAVAPVLAVSLRERTRGPWIPDLTLDLSWGGLQRHDSAGGSTRINSLTTLAFTVGVSRLVLPGLSARLGIGGLKYLPGEPTGIFRDGAGIAALGSGVLAFSPPLAARRRLGLTARYELHRFITPALRGVGFTESRLVHRFAIGLSGSLGGPR